MLMSDAWKETLNKPEVKKAFAALAEATARWSTTMKLSTLSIQAFNSNTDAMRETLRAMSDEELAHISKAVMLMLTNTTNEEVSRIERKKEEDAADPDGSEDHDPDGGRPEG
jgi:transglutaminase/protease-like cytokinesis protein 3